MSSFSKDTSDLSAEIVEDVSSVTSLTVATDGVTLESSGAVDLISFRSSDRISFTALAWYVDCCRSNEVVSCS